jgi:hypothetical protein
MQDEKADGSPQLFDDPLGRGEFNVLLCHRPCQNSFREARRHENWGNFQTLFLGKITIPIS